MGFIESTDHQPPTHRPDDQPTTDSPTHRPKRQDSF